MNTAKITAIVLMVAAVAGCLKEPTQAEIKKKAEEDANFQKYLHDARMARRGHTDLVFHCIGGVSYIEVTHQQHADYEDRVTGSVAVQFDRSGVPVACGGQP